MAFKKTEEKFVIPEVSVGVMKVRLSGASLIVNHFGAKSIAQMRDKQGGAARLKKEPKDPAQCFEDAKYKDEKGRDCIQALGIKCAIVDACRYADGLPMTKARESIFVRGTLLPLKFESCVMREDIVRVGKFPNKTADLRYRPEYINWSVECEVEYSTHVLTAEQLVNLISLAAFHVGYGEWRPSKGGDHGRFTVEVLSAAKPKLTAIKGKKAA